MPFLRRTNARARAAALATGATHTLLVHLALPAALALLAAGCTEELPPVGSLSDIGVVEGRVTECGQPLAALIRFEGAEDGPLSATVVAQADSTGWYHAELPLGRYRYRLRYGNSLAPSNSSVDTVAVGRVVRRLDLARGRAQVTVSLPAEVESLAVEVNLQGSVRRVDGGLASYYASAGGQLEDETATCDVRLLPPARYALTLDCQNGPWDIVIPQPGATTTPDTVRVGLDEVARFSFDFRPRYATLAGRVSGCPGLSPDSYVVELGSLNGVQIAHGSCRADGTYRLAILNPQPARLRVHHVYADLWYGGYDQYTADVIDLRQGARLAGYDLASGGLRLRFQGPGDRLDNAADLALIDPLGNSHQVYNYNQGDLLIGNLLPGDWRLQVLGGCGGEPWLPQWWQGAADQDSATPLTIVAGARLDLDLTLDAGGTIRGTFVRGSDEWFSSAEVAVHDLDGERLCWRTRGYVSDGFEFSGVADGTYLLGMYVNSLPWWYPGTWDRAQAQAVTVAGAGVVEGLAWRLPFPYKGARP